MVRMDFVKTIGNTCIMEIAMEQGKVVIYDRNECMKWKGSLQGNEVFSHLV